MLKKKKHGSKYKEMVSSRKERDDSLFEADYFEEEYYEEDEEEDVEDDFSLEPESVAAKTEGLPGKERQEKGNSLLAKKRVKPVGEKTIIEDDYDYEDEEDSDDDDDDSFEDDFDYESDEDDDFDHE